MHCWRLGTKWRLWKVKGKLSGKLRAIKPAIILSCYTDKMAILYWERCLFNTMQPRGPIAVGIVRTFDGTRGLQPSCVISKSLICAEETWLLSQTKLSRWGSKHALRDSFPQLSTQSIRHLPSSYWLDCAPNLGCHHDGLADVAPEPSNMRAPSPKKILHVPLFFSLVGAAHRHWIDRMHCCLGDFHLKL